MIASKRFRVALGVLLNAADLLVSFFLIFGGGFIANERSAFTGYASFVFGLVLIYLSTGMSRPAHSDPGWVSSTVR